MTFKPELTNNNSITEQYRALLEISETIISYRDLSQLFHNLSERLKSIVDFDYTSVMLYDAERDVMRMRLLETGIERTLARRFGRRLGLEESENTIINLCQITGLDLVFGIFR